MRWGDLTRSILFPLGVPALLSSLWFASWEGAYAEQADMEYLPPVHSFDAIEQDDQPTGPLQATMARPVPEISVAISQ